jgi:hypothetical protein
VPRVRWHAVHALLCDACKAGGSFLTSDVAANLQRVAEHDPSPKVRNYARQALSGRGAAEQGVSLVPDLGRGPAGRG